MERLPPRSSWAVVVQLTTVARASVLARQSCLSFRQHPEGLVATGTRNLGTTVPDLCRSCVFRGKLRPLALTLVVKSIHRDRLERVHVDSTLVQDRLHPSRRAPDPAPGLLGVPGVSVPGKPEASISSTAPSSSATTGARSRPSNKGVKRVMAAEYSRELSTKVFAGQCRLIVLGFRQGGIAGYGLRRMRIDQTGTLLGILGPGEYKSLQTDRVILVPGPPHEAETVRWMYHEFVETAGNRRRTAGVFHRQQTVLAPPARPQYRCSGEVCSSCRTVTFTTRFQQEHATRLNSSVHYFRP